MSEHDAFVLGRSDLNGFPFAEIGVEGSGLALSVLSALARLGLDPWREAGRLAALPRSVATDGLARLIAAMPASRWPLSNAAPIGTKLVALLPRRNDGSAAVAMRVRLKWRWLPFAAMTMALLAVSATHLVPAPGAPGLAPASIAAPVNPIRPLLRSR